MQFSPERRHFLRGITAAAIAGPGVLASCAHHPQNVTQISTGAASGQYFASNFGIGDELIKKTIGHALSRGGTFAEVFFQHSVGNYVGFEDGQVNTAYASVDLGAGVRVLNGDQTGYAYTEELTEKSLLAAADTAATIAAGAPRSGPTGFKGIELPKMYETRFVWTDVRPEQKIGLAQRVGEQIAAGDPSIIKSAVRFWENDEVVLIANSDGLMVEDIRPMTYLVGSCTAEKNGRRESNRYSRTARRGLDYYSEERLNKIVKETVNRTMLLFDAQTAPAGVLPVVLAPATSGILLHEAMGHGFEADFNRKGTSIFSTMMNEKVAEDFVTIVDTGLEPNARGAINVDDEGVPGQRTVLVENGKLVSYLHDRISAEHYGVAPTGNGRRESFRFAPLPRMRVTTMENGPHDPEEIIKSVKKGIYALDFGNGQVQIGAGDYSFYVQTGYLIEDGKLTTPIKDANLIGNGPDSLSKVVMVGNDKKIDAGTWTCGKDGQGVPVGLGLPTVKVSEITVGGVNG